MTEDFYRKLSQEEIEAERAEARFKYELQYNSDMYWSKKVGFEEGLQKGLQEGGKEVLKETAQKMLGEGIPADTIKRVTGLAPEEYQA